MAIWAAPGVECVCVSDFWETSGFDGPSKNERLTISEVYVNKAGLVTLRFTAHAGWLDGETPERHGYNVRNFRPIVPFEKDLALFEGVLDHSEEFVGSRL